MIKGINQQGRYTVVTGGMPSNPYISPGAVGAGMIRWNANMNCMEVSDGNTWKTLEMAYTSVGLTSQAESALDWALKKMMEEEEFKKLAETHPAVQIALENLNKAKQQLDATIILSKDHEKA